MLGYQGATSSASRVFQTSANISRVRGKTSGFSVSRSAGAGLEPGNAFNLDGLAYTIRNAQSKSIHRENRVSADTVVLNCTTMQKMLLRFAIV